MTRILEKWNKSYEQKAIILLSLGFGLVGLDRWIISPLLPNIVKDLNLNYQDVGYIFGALGMLWGIFAIFAGNLSDKFGHRKILIPSIILFSILSGFSGMATGLVSLLFIRGLMGATEGAYCPTSFAATAVAAKPSRIGLMQGVQQSGFPLFGLALGPIIATQLLLIVPSWREVFWVVAIPGIVIGVLMFFVIKDPQKVAPTQSEKGGSNWTEVLKTKNVVLCMLALFCSMACIFVLSAMIPLYLENYIHLSTQQMGGVMSAIGFGGFVGQFALPGLSDIIGRKKVAIISFVLAAIFVLIFAQIQSNTTYLFITLFLVSFCCLGNIAVITGPIATESAPIGLVASAIGLVVGAGEIFGGGIAPLIGGFIAENFGIQNVIYQALFGVALGAVVCLFLDETAPAILSKRKNISI
jgi:MFS family permease